MLTEIFFRKQVVICVNMWAVVVGVKNKRVTRITIYCEPLGVLLSSLLPFVDAYRSGCSTSPLGRLGGVNQAETRKPMSIFPFC